MNFGFHLITKVPLVLDFFIDFGFHYIKKSTFIFYPDDINRPERAVKSKNFEFQPNPFKIEEFDFFMDFPFHFITKVPLISIIMI